MRKELLARFILAAVVGVAIAVPVTAWVLQSRETVLHARIPENGGWLPENLKAEIGKPLHLKLTSDDVVHGFAVGKIGMTPVDIQPGEVTEVTLTFTQPGTYTFYCTRWCSLNHWRMRGVIEVSDPNGLTRSEPATPPQPPLYVTLGQDIDTKLHTDVVPALRPSAQRGAQLGAPVPAAYQSPEYYQIHSPVELWRALRTEKGLTGYSDQQIWDLVAWVWQGNTTPAHLEMAKSLYASNCAACHGEIGRGDGVFAEELAAPQATPHSGMSAGEMTTRPTNFTDPAWMLAANPARLQGKLLRGGMGTGMPSWGPIFTEEQTWALVAYLWTFQFELEN
jgi:cytochrome c oxidase subunit 2